MKSHQMMSICRIFAPYGVGKHQNNGNRKGKISQKRDLEENNHHPKHIGQGRGNLAGGGGATGLQKKKKKVKTSSDIKEKYEESQASS